jgi:hypothetical protein
MKSPLMSGKFRAKPRECIKSCLEISPKEFHLQVGVRNLHGQKTLDSIDFGSFVDAHIDRCLPNPPENNVLDLRTIPFADRLTI